MTQSPSQKATPRELPSERPRQRCRTAPLNRLGRSSLVSGMDKTRHRTLRRFFGVLILVVVCALAAVAVLAVRPQATDTSQEVVLKAVADTYVTAADPTALHGQDELLRIDSVPTAFVSLMTFRLPDLGPSVARATLRLHAASPNIWGAAVTAVDKIPTNTTTWRTRPRTTDLAGLLPASPNQGGSPLTSRTSPRPANPSRLPCTPGVRRWRCTTVGKAPDWDPPWSYASTETPTPAHRRLELDWTGSTSDRAPLPLGPMTTQSEQDS